VFIFADTIRCDHVTLIFDRSRKGKCPEMFNARERPRGRDDKSADVLLDYEFSVHLRKPKIVTNTEAKAQAAQSKTPKRIARNKTPLFVNGRDCIQMGFSIFRSNFSPPIDKDQGIV